VKIGVLDYGAGNLGSVMNALSHIGAEASFVEGPRDMKRASSRYDKIIFPGDGHFATTMASLEKSGYDDALKEWIGAEKPFLGICIGLQVLFEKSEEAPPINGKVTSGLGVIKGTVRKFECRKVPQIGWNSTSVWPSAKMFKGIDGNPFFYYIHSFYADPVDVAVVTAFTEYDVFYCSAIERGALAAVQFHPEKSGKVGMKFLENWVLA
jgi:imidazole glycerol phosphate synthase glutamine amidotransferase subunit